MKKQGASLFRNSLPAGMWGTRGNPCANPLPLSQIAQRTRLARRPSSLAVQVCDTTCTARAGSREQWKQGKPTHHANKIRLDHQRLAGDSVSAATRRMLVAAEGFCTARRGGSCVVRVSSPRGTKRVVRLVWHPPRLCCLLLGGKWAADGPWRASGLGNVQYQLSSVLPCVLFACALPASARHAALSCPRHGKRMRCAPPCTRHWHG